MKNAITSINNSSKPRKKRKGVLLLKSPMPHIIKGLSTNQSRYSNNHLKDNSSSNDTPLSTSVGLTLRKTKQEDKGNTKKFLLTATNQSKSYSLTKKSAIQFGSSQPPNSNDLPKRYCSLKDHALYLNNCTKVKSYKEKSFKCVSRNRINTNVNTNSNNDKSNDDIQDKTYLNENETSLNFIEKSFKPVKLHLAEMMKNNKKELQHYITIETTQAKIPLCHKEKFDPRVRYPMLYCNYKLKENKTFVPHKRFSLNNITNKFPLQNEVRETVKCINRGETIKTKKEKLQKWKRIIIHAAIESKQHHVTIDDLMRIPKKSLIPYEHNQSYELFQAVKDGDKSNFIKLVRDNYCLVFDFDHASQTILHWLAKRNKYDWISFTVRQGASLNSLDCTGRTPLHIASLLNNVESVQVLLYEMANPFSKDNDGYTPNQLTSHPRIIFIFNRVILLYAIHSMGKSKKFEENVKRGLRFLYINELKTNFSINNFCIIEKNNNK